MAEQSSVFDMIGPVMIGPSSSHTAGVVRIGRVARKFLGAEPVQAEHLGADAAGPGACAPPPG